jgi:hypothetical protein
MKCPKTRKCPKVDGSDMLAVIEWRVDKRPLCKKCNNGKDKRSKNALH